MLEGKSITSLREQLYFQTLLGNQDANTAAPPPP